MDWDDEFDNEYVEMAYDPHRDSAMSGIDPVGGHDPMDITDPASAYFFLSDDAQNEITGSDKKKMKCLSCGHTFVGEMYDRCPECFSSDTEQMTGENDGYW
jgi:hypothetical protein